MGVVAVGEKKALDTGKDTVSAAQRLVDEASAGAGVVIDAGEANILQAWSRAAARPATPKEQELLAALGQEYGVEQLVAAIGIAAANNRVSVGYARGVLQHQNAPPDRAAPMRWDAFAGQAVRGEGPPVRAKPPRYGRGGERLADTWLI